MRDRLILLFQREYGRDAMPLGGLLSIHGEQEQSDVTDGCSARAAWLAECPAGDASRRLQEKKKAFAGNNNRITVREGSLEIYGCAIDGLGPYNTPYYSSDATTPVSERIQLCRRLFSRASQRRSSDLLSFQLAQ
jgi:hypothetical protein